MAGCSTDELPEAHVPTNVGVMKGWLSTSMATQPGSHRPCKLWFVLSLETLAYYRSPESEEPLGMLGIDEMRSVRGGMLGAALSPACLRDRPPMPPPTANHATSPCPHLMATCPYAQRVSVRRRSTN
jgi:hypothetical protein